MTFTYNEKRLKITDDIKQYCERKLSKLDRLFHDGGDAGVKFSRERGRYGVEVTINFSGTIFRVSELTHDQQACIDSAVAAIERQVRKNKTRLSKRIRTGIQERAVDSIPYYDDADAGSDGDHEEFNITKTKRFAIKPTSPEEAILQMNLLDHQFYAFKNADEDDAYAIVYKRNDGSYGLITTTDE